MLWSIARAADYWMGTKLLSTKRDNASRRGMKVRSKFSSLLILAEIVLLSSMLVVNIGSSDITPKWGGTLVWILPADPNTLNPNLSPNSWAMHVLGNVYQGLIRHKLGTNGEWIPIPSLAESWDVSNDGLSYTYHLYRNITWHDGVPFTSEDVKFSFENQVIPLSSGGKTTFAAVQSIETPDNFTVVFRLKNVDAAFFTMNVIFNAGIVAKHLYTHVNGTVFSGSEIRSVGSNPDWVIGTGPFVYKEYVKGDHLTLERNPNYFVEGLPYLDKIVYRIVPDPTMRALTMEAGEADFYPQTVGTADVAGLNVTQDIVVTTRGMEYSGAQFILFFNMNNNTYLKNNLVRKAISYALDRSEMSLLATNGVYTPGTSAVGSALGTWKNPNVSEPWYNVTMANLLLDEAGYPKDQDGIRFNLRYQWDTTYSTELSKCAEILRDQLEKVGISVELIPMDTGTFQAKTWVQWDYDMTMWPFGAGPDPSRIGRYYHSRSIGHSFGANVEGYNNSIVDTLLDQAASTIETTTRQTLYWQIQEILAGDLPTLHVLERLYLTAYNTQFNGILNSVWGFRDPMYDVWWAQATGTSPPGETLPSETSFPLLEVTAGVVVVLIVTLVGVMYFRRKKK